MTKYESAVAYVKAHDRWEKLWQWASLFKIGIHCESTELLKTTRAQIVERTKKALGDELSTLYFGAVSGIDAFNNEFKKAMIKSRQDMDKAHLEMLKTCFPLNESGRYTVLDRNLPIEFTMEDRRYISAYIAGKSDQSVCGYFDFKCEDYPSRNHSRFSIDKNDKVFFTSEEDLY